MSALLAFPQSFALVESPGVVRAVSSSQVGLNVGEDVKQAIGVGWQALLETVREAHARGEGGATLVTPRARFRATALTGAANDTPSILLVLEEAAGARVNSTIPPPSSAPRFVSDLAAVAGKDASARAAVDLAMRFARTMLPIYIAADDGSGADVLAAALLRANNRAEGPLRRVSARDPDMFATLFPANGGSFGNGTLLLEDAHELDNETGARLARELDRGIYAETQLIATGSGDLRGRVAKGSFARELFTLVRSSTVSLPPLRDRDDIEYLVALTLSEIERKLTDAHGAPRAGKLELRPEVLPRLREHLWRGNLRELRAWFERAAAAASPKTLLGVEHFPFEVSESRGEADGKARTGLRRSAEKAALEEALRAATGNVSVASKKLGVARSTLYRLMLRHGIVR
jgi:sigma-54 dependent transcriptional regulator, acetoin dehydrogenase operon transcriptional activator AcoR